jgi:hypothetical protein
VSRPKATDPEAEKVQPWQPQPFDQETEAAEPPEQPEPADVEPPEPAEPAAAEEAADPAPAPEWTGGFEPYAVGDPGRAALEVVAQLFEDPAAPADTLLDAARVGGLVVRAASVCGTSHRYRGTPRQDDYALCVVADRWLVVAVADGVSAGALSHQAATIACRGAAGLVREALVATDAPEQIPWGEVLDGLARRIVAHGRRVLGDEQSAEEITAADVARAMATTLLVVVLPVEADADGCRRGALIAVGDPSAFALGADGAWSALTAVKNADAEVATSATAALPYLPAELPAATPIELAAGERVFVMTDGVGDPLGHGDGDVGRFLASAWAQPPDPVAFAAQVGFARKSYDDDRTVVGVWAAG